MEGVGRDVAYGMRMARRRPGFAALVVATLALGIGAATAVFSLVDAAILRALPYRDAGRLVYLFDPNPRFPGIPVEAFGPMNAEFYAWRAQSRSYAALAMYAVTGMNLESGGSAAVATTARVKGEFFDVLGARPAMGRAFGADGDEVLISARLWRERFGGSRGVLGETIRLDAKPYKIVGVMPERFAFPHGTEDIETAGKRTEVWIPWAMTPREKASWEDGAGTAIARLRPGVSAGQAEAELRAMLRRMDARKPEFFRGGLAVVRPFAEEITGASRRPLWLFLGAVGLVLLVACGNAAGLLLTRALGREAEMGVRAALGASRGRLVRQMLAECVCLAGAAGVAGLGVGWVMIRVLLRFGAGDIPRMEETGVDWRVLLFAIAVSAVTVALFGLAPAVAATRGSLNEALKRGGGRRVSGGASKLQRGLMAGEVGLTMVLLVGAGLLLRSFLNLEGVSKGFDARSTVTMSVRLDGRYGGLEKQNAFFHDLVERTRQLPGVEAVGAINYLPLGGGESVSMVQVEGKAFDGKTLFEERAVTPDYFRAMGIRLVEGRSFREADRANAPLVAVVSRGLARTYFPEGDAVGKRLKDGDGQGNAVWWTIVGVVDDVRMRDLESAPPMQIYRPLWQLGGERVSVVVRSAGDVGQVARGVEGVVREMDPAIAVAGIATMGKLVSGAEAGRRFQTGLVTAFGGMSLFLALVGLYGLVSYSVEQRTAEIGIRMALGAGRGSVVGLFLKEAASVAGIGVVVGISGAMGAARLMGSLLYDVKPEDPATIAGAALLFFAVAVAACVVPSRRATQVDPVVALRAE
jgi:putative ABC transport system permease protein